MEACVGAHHLSRQLQALGHDARLMPAQYVKPYLRGQKNNFRDAEAIAEAVQRPRMRFVPTKSVEQLDLQAIHRVRSRLVRHRTAVINQIRALLLERGIAVRQGVRFLQAALPDILGRHSEFLSPRMVRVIAELSGDFRHLSDRLDDVTAEIETLAKADDACQRLITVPGIGPIIASAMVSAIGDGAAFGKGRDFATWLGLVPRQMSTGGCTILGRISKRGNSYLRTLFIRGARGILLRPENWPKQASVPGSKPRPDACTAMSWLWRLPTSWPVSPGACSPISVVTKPGAPPPEPRELRRRGTTGGTHRGLREGRKERAQQSAGAFEIW